MNNTVKCLIKWLSQRLIMHNSLKTHPSRQMFEANPKLWKKKTKPVNICYFYRARIWSTYKLYNVVAIPRPIQSWCLEISKLHRSTFANSCRWQEFQIGCLDRHFSICTYITYLCAEYSVETRILEYVKALTCQRHLKYLVLTDT